MLLAMMPSILVGRQNIYDISSRAAWQEMQNREATVKSANKSLKTKDSDTIPTYVKGATCLLGI